MSDSKSSRFTDQELTAGLTPVKEIVADPFGGKAIKTSGWNIQRLAELGDVDEVTDERPYRRDKEYAFRPHIAGLVFDQLRYRHFSNPPTGTVQGTSSWVVNATEVGFEMSTVADFEGRHKFRPDWNPSHHNGPNRSGLVISRRLLEKADDRRSLPERYFSRSVDLMVPISTQDIKLKRVEYGDEFRDKTPNTKQYQDGIWKTALNITPFDNPIDKELDQLTEEASGPGKHGFKNHAYVTGFPDIISDPKPPANYFQGGWMYDGVQDVLANFQDLIGIDAIKNDFAKLPRYLNRFKQRIGIPFIRHDAHFNKEGDDECPPPFGNGTRKSGRIFFTIVES